MLYRWSFCVVALVAGAVHHASAARQLSEAAPFPSSTKQFLPHKDADGVWQPANLTGVDFNTLTLADLPTLDTFLEISMASPYPMPNIPLMLLVNNTLKDFNGGKLPMNADEWAGLLLAESTGKYVTSNLPHFLVKYLPNITMPDGKVLSMGEQANKVLTTMVSDTNGTKKPPATGSTITTMGVPPAPANLIQGMDATLEVVKRLPNLFRQVAQNVGDAIEVMDVPQVGEAFTDDGTLDIAGILKSALNIQVNTPSVPALQALKSTPEITSKAIVGIAKALPAVAAELGLNNTAIKFPEPAAVEAVLQKANGNQLFVTDKYGRMDLLATLVQLPQKVPELNKVAQAVEAATTLPQGWPDLDEVAGTVVKMVMPRLRGGPVV